jgi:hypothetical protein
MASKTKTAPVKNRSFDELVKQKRAAGLTKEQAERVAKAQIDRDANPLDYEELKARQAAQDSAASDEADETTTAQA